MCTIKVWHFPDSVKYILSLNCSNVKHTHNAYSHLRLSISTLSAGSIYYRPFTFYKKSVLTLYMCSYLIHKLTFKMKYPAAFYTLKMQMFFAMVSSSIYWNVAFFPFRRHILLSFFQLSVCLKICKLLSYLRHILFR